jgi:hypothetical protein
MKTVASRRFCYAFRTTSTVFIREARWPKYVGQNILDMQDPFPYPHHAQASVLSSIEALRSKLRRIFDPSEEQTIFCSLAPQQAAGNGSLADSISIVKR